LFNVRIAVEAVSGRKIVVALLRSIEHHIAGFIVDKAGWKHAAILAASHGLAVNSASSSAPNSTGGTPGQTNTSGTGSQNANPMFESTLSTLFQLQTDLLNSVDNASNANG
jgi:hypothetical protein